MWLAVVGREIAALAVAGGFVVIAYVVGVKSTSATGVLTRWVASIAALTWAVSMAFHLLAAFTAFSLWPALGVVGFSAAVALRSAGGLRGLRPALARDMAFVRRAARLLRRSRFRWIVLGFWVCLSPAVLHALLVPALGWDALTYHMVKAGAWAQSGGRDSMIGPGPWAYYRNMLGGGEVFPAWALLLLQSDTLVTAIDVAQWLGLGFACLVLARRLGAREPFASAGVGFLLALPTIRLLVGSGYVENGLLMALTVGVVLALDAVRTRRAALVVLACAALGIAGAAKMPALVIAGALLPAVVLAAGRYFDWRWSAAGVLVFTLGFAPWVIRSMARTGLPFSPVPVDVAGIRLGAAPPELEWYMRRLAMRPYELRAEWRVLQRVFARPGTRSEALGGLALLPLCYALAALRTVTRRSALAVVLAAVATVANLSEYYDPGFSVVRHYWAESSSRFLLPAVMLLTLLSVAVSRRSAWHARAYLGYLWAATFFNAIAYAAFGFSRVSLEGVVIELGGILMLAGVLLVIARRPRIALAGTVTIALVAVTGLHVLRDAFRNELFVSDYVIYPVPRYWMGALGYVDHPLVHRRIAVTSGPLQNLDNWFVAPLLGRSLENEVLYVSTTTDGRILHWDTASNNDVIRAASDMNAWTRRLHDEQVSEVLSFEPESVELDWMESHPGTFDRLDGEPHRWGLFAVKR